MWPGWGAEVLGLLPRIPRMTRKGFSPFVEFVSCVAERMQAFELLAVNSTKDTKRVQSIR